jgi:hypothetical protein
MTTENPMFPPPVDLGGNVVSLAGRRPADAEPPPEPWPEIDRDVLATLIEWRITRATVESVWARQELQNCQGIRQPDHKPGHKPPDFVERMQVIEAALSVMQPKTIRTATEMLNMVLMILAAREVSDYSTLGTGPVFELVRNVRDALNRTPDATVIGWQQH